MSAKNTPKSADMNSGPGFRIRTDFERPSKEIIKEYSTFESPDISDMLNRMYAMQSGIRNMANDLNVCGPACTVKVFPGDNLMVHKVLDVAQPGDVVVIDAGGCTNNAVLGDLITSKAKHRGIAAFVIDGLIRDLPDVKKIGIPVFARGETPIGPMHRGPGEINHPISCGGIVVNPGDIIVGDSSGLVVVRQEFAQDTLEKLYVQRKSLESYVEAVKRGEFSNQWVDTYLEEKNCVITKD